VFMEAIQLLLMDVLPPEAVMRNFYSRVTKICVSRVYVEVSRNIRLFGDVDREAG
jgi:hypothetical protein